MKKGRHRRFEEARALKRSVDIAPEPCAECGAMPGADHASWCMATEDEQVDEDADWGSSTPSPSAGDTAEP